MRPKLIPPVIPLVLAGVILHTSTALAQSPIASALLSDIHYDVICYPARTRRKGRSDRR